MIIGKIPSMFKIRLPVFYLIRDRLSIKLIVEENRGDDCKAAKKLV